MACRPPGAQGVFQQEAHHVVFGEELGHRRQVGPADLAAAGVHFLLLVRLPELIDPAQAIVGREDRGRQAGQDRFQPLAALRRKAHLDRRVVGQEDAGQHRAGVARSQVPGVGCAFLWGQLRALFQRVQTGKGGKRAEINREEACKMRS